MQEKNIVEEAFIQLKNVEEAMSENAKGILNSVMKEEINQLVKESLSEQEEDDLDTDVEIDADADELDVDGDEGSDDIDLDVDVDMDTDQEDDTDMLDMDVDSDESPIDLTDASDEEILKVFKAMGEDDGIIIKKDGEEIHLTDNDTDSEYLVKLGESEEKIRNKKIMKEVSNVDDVIAKLFAEEKDDMDETIYEIEFDEEVEESKDEEDEAHDMDESWKDEEDEAHDMDESYDEEDESEMDEAYDEEDEAHDMDEAHDESEMDEAYDEEDESEMDEAYDEEDESEMEESWSDVNEAYSHKKSKKTETKEGKSTVKPKGVGIGSGPKFSYKKTSGGFKEDKKEGPKTMGTGSAKKFKFGKGENTEGKMKTVKKTETKEAARTYGFGRKQGGANFKKGITNNRNLKTEALEAEVKLLRQKNEEYRKALNIFREKLNEVAIFNSNLAYATRLFTEHSTTKKEKINILRRFDGVETLKESKNLYKSIKDELSNGETKSINESVEKKIISTPQTGSSTTLIESKTYEAPQFLRIKDLMSKIG